MEVNMNQRDLDNNSSFLQIKELKEKVRSLVSEVDLNRENAKFKHERYPDNNISGPNSNEENDEEFIDCSEIETLDETNWLSETNSDPESAKDVCKRVYSDIDEYRPDISKISHQLQLSSISEPNIFSNQGVSIDSRTFTRPKKYTARPSLTSVLNTEDGRPKLQRRLTTTISPTPTLISKLEELSKTNNRSVSGNHGESRDDEGLDDSMSDLRKASARAKRQSLPASLFDRLQELKRANSSFKIPQITDQNVSSGKMQERDGRKNMLEDAKKVTAALDIDIKNSHSSRLSEIFRNTQDYYSDDNESFISLDEVSGFCDRLTLSTDQSTYSSIVREMEQNEICLFHRPMSEKKTKDGRMTFGGIEIPEEDFLKDPMGDQIMDDDDNDLNRTYEIDEEEPNKQLNNTFELQRNVSKHNVMNTTYDANRKSGLVDVILKSDILKDVSPNAGQRKTRESLGNNNNINNNRTSTFDGNNVMNFTYDKHNGTLDQNELNALRTEKYSTKIFDSSFRKGNSAGGKSPTRKSNGRKESDHSEDDCMSTTSDHSYRSTDSNYETKSTEYGLRNAGTQQRKKVSSTPITGQIGKIDFEVVSPIRMEIGDGESNTYSNSSSRGQSPRRIGASMHQEGMPRQRMPNLRQPLKVPQRELKLKPALIRPSQNFKRPLSYSRTSSEPSVPQKVESFQPPANTPPLRPLGPTSVPSLTNVRPSSRTSGIPRPPTRLKQPQIRVNYSKK